MGLSGMNLLVRNSWLGGEDIGIWSEMTTISIVIMTEVSSQVLELSSELERSLKLQNYLDQRD